MTSDFFKHPRPSGIPQIAQGPQTEVKRDSYEYFRPLPPCPFLSNKNLDGDTGDVEPTTLCDKSANGTINTFGPSRGASSQPSGKKPLYC